MRQNTQQHSFTRGVAFALLPVLALLAGGCLPSAAPPPTQAAAPPAPEFLYDYAEARRLAKEQDRPLMVLFTYRDCPCCRYMLQHALRDPAAVESMAAYICVHVELEQEPELCHQFRVQSLPTNQLLNSEGVAVRRVTGEMPGEKVASLLRDTAATAESGNIRAARHTPYTFGDPRSSVR